MKKMIILLVLVLCLTGCKAVVNVNIDENAVTENVTVKATSDAEYRDIENWIKTPLPLYYDQDLENPFGTEKERGVPYYDINSNNETKTVTGNASFDFSKHSKSSLVRNCFKYYNVITEDDITIFSTSKGLICSYTNFDIVVTTPYKIVNSNATRVDQLNNKYIWTINESNVNNASVYLEIDFSQKSDGTAIENPLKQKEEQESKSDTGASRIVFFSIAFGILLVILIALLSLYIRYKATVKL